MRNKLLTTITVAVCLAAGVAQPLRAQDQSRIERSERRRAAMVGLAPNPAERPVGGQYSPQTLEDLRVELLNIADSVQEFAAFAPAQLVDTDSLQQARAQIQQMPPQFLNTLRKVIDPAKLHGRLLRARAVLEKYSASRPDINRNTNMTQDLLPADSADFPDASESCLLNSADGTSVTRFPTALVIADDVIFFIADVVRESAQDTCKQILVVAGEGGNASLVCIPLDIIWIAAKAVNEGIHFCDDDLTGAVGDASYKRLGAINDEIGTLQTGVSSIDKNTSNVGAQLTTIGNQISTVGAQVSALDTHLSTVETDILNALAAHDAHMTMLLGVLQASVDLANQRLLKTIAGELQIMKLDLTPDGSRILVPSILTCSGSTCPNVLALCPGGVCSWNNVGPLP
jgi:hypothetical protein